MPDANAALERLWVERRLRLVGPSEQGDAIDRLPDGEYGFSYAPQTEGAPPFANRTYQAFEVHKLAGGAIHLLGFVTEEEARLLDQDGGCSIHLYPEPWKQAAQLVSVPAGRVVRAKNTSREKGNFLPLDLGPAVLAG